MDKTWRDKQKLLKGWVQKGHWVNLSLCWLLEFPCFSSECNRITVEFQILMVSSCCHTTQNRSYKEYSLYNTLYRSNRKVTALTKCSTEIAVDLHVWNRQTQFLWYFSSVMNGFKHTGLCTAYFGNRYHFRSLFGVCLLKDLGVQI